MTSRIDQIAETESKDDQVSGETNLAPFKHGEPGSHGRGHYGLGR